MYEVRGRQARRGGYGETEKRRDQSSPLSLRLIGYCGQAKSRLRSPSSSFGGQAKPRNPRRLDDEFRSSETLLTELPTFVGTGTATRRCVNLNGINDPTLRLSDSVRKKPALPSDVPEPLIPAIRNLRFSDSPVLPFTSFRVRILTECAADTS